MEVVNERDDDLVNLSRADIRFRIDSLAGEYTIATLSTGVPTEGSYFSTHYQTMEVITTLRKMVDTNRSRSVRGVFYCHKRIFHSYGEFQPFLARLLQSMRLSMVHVNIIPNIKGTIVASPWIQFVFSDNKGGKLPPQTYPPTNQAWPAPSVLEAFYGVAADEETEGVLDELDDDVIRATVEFEVEDGQREPEFCILCEKDSLPDELARGDFFNKYSAIVINTKGYATHNTYALLKMLHQKWPLMKIIAFNDASPSGVDIMMRGYYMNTTKAKFSVPIILGGLLITDIIDHDEIQNAMVTTEQPLSDWDRTCLRRISQHPWYKNSVQNQDIYNLIRVMREQGKKWELNLFDPPGGITKFVIDRLKNETYIRGPRVAMRDE